MLIYRLNKNGGQTIDDPRHPFVRLPDSGGGTIFKGWGPTI